MDILGGKYKINVKEIGDLYKMMKNGELIYAPYYQRNFVWEEADQIEFIETILSGYPCPEIFIAEGKIDLETHTKYIHVIDGQQRLTTIKKFFDNELKVKGKYYKDLEPAEKEKVHSYELGTITLKLNPEIDIAEIEEIFRRLNKNKYALNETEKRVSLLSSNEFMLFARLLSGDLLLRSSEDLDEKEEELFIRNPFIKQEFKDWANDKDFESIFAYLEQRVYSSKQITQNYITKDIIDIIGCYIKKDFFSRILEDDEIVELTPEVNKKRNKIYNMFSKIISIFNKIEFPLIEGVRKKDFFMMRGNCFSLIVALMWDEDNLDNLNIELFQANLKKFVENLPEDYKAAARNSVMDKKQRRIRHEYLLKIIANSIN